MSGTQYPYDHLACIPSTLPYRLQLAETVNLDHFGLVQHWEQAIYEVFQVNSTYDC